MGNQPIVAWKASWPSFLTQESALPHPLLQQTLKEIRALGTVALLFSECVVGGEWTPEVQEKSSREGVGEGLGKGYIILKEDELGWSRDTEDCVRGSCLEQV